MPADSHVALGAAVSEPPREQRLFHRYDMALEAEMRTGERALRCTIRDLSLGGAGLSPALPELRGRTVRLLWDGLELAGGLRATVVQTTAERTHLTFDLDHDSEIALTMFLLTAAVPGS